MTKGIGDDQEWGNLLSGKRKENCSEWGYNWGDYRKRTNFKCK